ncbi:very short patch repair endonuclease [Pseudomonas argentinensis]|uniref:very short patch repair endonuclease n=1 Tax=Phytopseudomonas argentinensis TaxID=289370 RepID=UPI0009F2B063|nr:DNA mismatch endonuclease Vsr [Pseudomonas argentinensis]
MRAVRRQNTAPEIRVRSVLHRVGLRFRIHQKNLPGSPDIVLAKHKTVVFVHGCFWHRHPGCRYATTPKTRQEFWIPKFDANIKRDARKEAQLRELGWRVLVVWECETKDLLALEARLRREFDLPLSGPRTP